MERSAENWKLQLTSRQTKHNTTYWKLSVKRPTLSVIIRWKPQTRLLIHVCLDRVYLAHQKGVVYSPHWKMKTVKRPTLSVIRWWKFQLDFKWCPSDWVNLAFQMELWVRTTANTVCDKMKAPISAFNSCLSWLSLLGTSKKEPVLLLRFWAKFIRVQCIE